MSVSVAALLPCKTGSGIPATRSSAAVLILVLGSFRIDCRLLPHDLHPRAADARLRVSRLVHARARPRERSVAGLEPYPSSIQRGARRCGWLVSPLVRVSDCASAGHITGDQCQLSRPKGRGRPQTSLRPRSGHSSCGSSWSPRAQRTARERPFACRAPLTVSGTTPRATPRSSRSLLVQHRYVHTFSCCSHRIRRPSPSLVFALFAGMLACLCFHTGLEPILTAVRSARENMASTP